MFGPVAVYRVGRWLHLRRRRRLARLAKLLTYVLFKSILPPEAKIGPNFELGHLGLGVIMHPRTEIGADVFVHPGVIFAADIPLDDPQCQTLGSRITIGSHAVLLGPIAIGDDVVIGAGAVVTKDIPAGSVVMGVPARVVSQRGAMSQKLR